MKRISSSRWARALAIAASAGLASSLASGFAWGQAEPLRIAVINPFSGPLALYGEEVARGYQIAIDEANARGGVVGRKIELLRGDAGSPPQGIAAVEKLASQDKVEVFTGTYISAVSNAASDAALRYNRIYWDTNALAGDLTERGLPNFIRSGPFATSFAEVSADATRDLLAPALKKDIKNLKVWIEHEDSIFGTSIAELQKTLLEKMGAKVVGLGAHNFRAIDLNDSILRAKAAEPDVWIETGYVPDGSLLLRTMRDQGLKVPAIMMLATGDTFETLDALGAEYLEGITVVGYPRSDQTESFGPGASAYLGAYKAKYNRDPVAPQGMTAYVGMQMLIEAIAAAGGTDMEKVRAAAAKMDKPAKSYATGFGVKFDEKFQNTRAFPTVVQWQSGKVVTVFPKDAAQPSVKLVNLPRQ
jgi:branched-chain amino acid transport system substrate-binding protein